MKRVITVLIAGLLCTGSVLAQEQQPQVLDRSTGQRLSSASVSVWGPVRMKLTTDKDGRYSLSNLPNGRYTITISAAGYEAQQFEYLVNDGKGQSLKSIKLAPISEGNDTEAFSIVEDLSEDTSGLGTEYGSLLHSSRDPYNAAASFAFSPARFLVRGYDNQYNSQLLNGIYMNDLNTGYSVWNLWSGLNDLTRLQSMSTSSEPIDMGIGSLGATGNLQMRPSLFRAGRRLTYSNSNRTYSNRAMATWTTGKMQNGWSFTLAGSRRWGNGEYSYVRGMHYDAWNYFLGVEKQFDEHNSLALIAFASPTRRGVASASTQEAYDLAGSNFYNPNMGRQGGKWRNARERNNHEPVVQLTHYFEGLKKTLQINTSLSYRFGTNSYSALNWFNAPDPRADYYRYLPSYFTYMSSEVNRDQDAANVYADLWASDPNVRYIDWDNLYKINRNNTQPLYSADGKLLAEGKRALYLIEERHTDQRELGLASNANWVANDWLRLDGGLHYRYNKTANYNVVGDLLGADYLYDVDKFAERDFGGDAEKSQIDLNNPDHIARKGDRFGYDYNSIIEQYGAWANARYSFARLDAYTALGLIRTNMHREGNQRRGLFPENSYGASKNIHFLDLSAKAGLTYKLNGQHYLVFNAAYIEQAPTFASVFVSPRTRNTVVDDLKSEKMYALDASYEVRLPWLRGRVTAFYSEIKDKTRSMSFYDDARAAFSNFVLSGVGTKHAGIELGLEGKISPALSVNGALSYGHYTYNTNPSYIQTIDNSNAIIDRDIVYWKGLMLSGTPQTAATLGLKYQTSWYGTFGISGNYFGRNYVSMNPVLRTDKGREAFGSDITTPERLKDGFTVDVFAGYSWRIAQGTFLRFNLSVSNILNNKNIHSGAFEQLRVRTQTSEGKTSLYRPFDTKYSYLYGTTFFFNTSLQF